MIRVWAVFIIKKGGFKGFLYIVQLLINELLINQKAKSQND